MIECTMCDSQCMSCGDRRHRRLVVDAARRRRADDRQVPRLARLLRPGAGAPSQRRDQESPEADAVHLHGVRPLLGRGPCARVRRSPGSASVVAAARSTILTNQGQDAASPQRNRDRCRPLRSRIPMQHSPRFRPFETALDPDAALARAARAPPPAPTTASSSSSAGAAESLVFDDGRLRNASYDAAEGFGLRAVRGETAGYAHSTEISRGRAPARRRDRAARGRRRRRHPGRGAASHQPAALHRPRPLRRRRVRGEGRDAARDRRLPARPRPARRPGLRQPRRLDAGGRDPPPRRHPPRRGPADGAAQHLGHRRGERPPRIGLGRRRRAATASRR